MVIEKKDVRKIQKATKEELAKLQAEYEALSENIHGMSPVGLLLIALGGVAVILTFQSNLLDFIGLAMVFIPLYIFVQRGAHRKGYFEGYYEMMTKVSSRPEEK